MTSLRKSVLHLPAWRNLRRFNCYRYQVWFQLQVQWQRQCQCQRQLANYHLCSLHQDQCQQQPQCLR